MGLLVAKKYPTKLFLQAADHTYVECGSGAKGWSCWGGKTGGTAFNSGIGSTTRADHIATPNERANIACYLVNGVCHQIANRILLPAGILVSGARGYGVSSALFGAYGKVLAGPCHSPFNQHRTVSGDLPECAIPIHAPSIPLLNGEEAHFEAIRQAYEDTNARPMAAQDALRFSADLFDMEVRFRLGENLGLAGEALRNAKSNADREHLRLVTSLGNGTMRPVEFIKSFNAMTLAFQGDLAAALNADQYARLLGLGREERVVLADPEIIRELYGEDTVRAVYGNL